MGGYGGIACLGRDGVRKAKAHLELKLAREVEDNMKGFLHKYAGSKREAKESVGPLPSEIGGPSDKGKVDVLDAFFASFFTGKAYPQTWQSLWE